MPEQEHPYLPEEGAKTPTPIDLSPEALAQREDGVGVPTSPEASVGKQDTPEEIDDLGGFEVDQTESVEAEAQSSEIELSKEEEQAAEKFDNLLSDNNPYEALELLRYHHLPQEVVDRTIQKVILTHLQHGYQDFAVAIIGAFEVSE